MDAERVGEPTVAMFHAALLDVERVTQAIHIPLLGDEDAVILHLVEIHGVSLDSLHDGKFPLRSAPR